MTVSIQLTKGQVALIDDRDEGEVRQHKWCAQKSPGRTFYAYTSINGRKVYLHRFLLKPPAGQEVDHRNRDGLDNQRSNLRAATHSQNGANYPKPNRTGFRGVTAVRSKFVASITSSQAPRRTSLGYFSTPEEAARAYDAAAFARFGEFATLNFPPGDA